MTDNYRHAVSKQTGATTLAFRADRAQWKVLCMNHGTETTVANRGEAWTTSSHPATFCAKCKAIVAGKAKRITEPRLSLPTPGDKVAAKTTTARKAAAKKAS